MEVFIMTDPGIPLQGACPHHQIGVGGKSQGVQGSFLSSNYRTRYYQIVPHRKMVKLGEISVLCHCAHYANTKSDYDVNYVVTWEMFVT